MNTAIEPATNGTQPQLDPELCWRAVLAKDARFDGSFVLAVRSTGIYCRPVCPARRPARERVTFFATPGEAEGAGFRACKRCRPEVAGSVDGQLDLVQRACAHIDGNLPETVTLADLSEHLQVSPYHLQRTFKRHVGISPDQYAKARRVAGFKGQVRDAQSVTTAMYDAGFGSSSRLYETAEAELGMTPATYRRGGQGMRISYTVVDSPLGRLLVAATGRGVCRVCLGDDDAELEAVLREEYFAAEIVREESHLGQWIATIVGHLSGADPRLDVPVDIRATAFQRRVWQALREIPYGATKSYSQVARDIGQPSAVRAVARACATNPTAVIIPCHRVVGSDGALTGYRWGVERKRALLAREQMATIVVADVVGSTALTERLGDRPARDLLRRYEQAMREAVVAHGGVDVKGTGDGLLASFPLASSALQGAVRMQSSVHGLNDGAEQPVEVRVGVNAGEPVVEDGDVFGLTVNLACRIAERAAGGQILVSDIVRQLTNGKGFAFADRGEAALKGVARPVRVFELPWRD